jgi:flagellar motor switch protein FliG
MAKSKNPGGGVYGPGGNYLKPDKNKGNIWNRAEYGGFWDELEKAGQTAEPGNFLKTTDNKKTKESKYRKVARFLVLIGSEEAAKILSRLEPGQVEAIAREVAGIKSISQEEAEQILDEFRHLLAASYGMGGLSQGGIEAARKLLYEAFGPEKGEDLLNHSVPDSRGNPFDFLEDYSGEQLAFLLKGEAPATSALILSRISPELSAASLANMEPGQKLEIVMRIARQGTTTPDILDRVASALREKIRQTGQSGRALSEVDGMNALAAILRHSEGDFNDKILEQLEDHDPDLTNALKDRLNTLDDVINAEDRPLQEKLRNMSNRDIVLLLKGRSDDFTQKIYGNLSSNRRSRILEEAALIGKVPKKEADAVVRDFLAWFRVAREEGQIIMLNSEDIVQ